MNRETIKQRISEGNGLGAPSHCRASIPVFSVSNGFGPEIYDDNKSANDRYNALENKGTRKKLLETVSFCLRTVMSLTAFDNANSIQNSSRLRAAVLLVAGLCLMPATSTGLELPITLEFEKGVDLSYDALAHLYPSAVTFDSAGREICITESRGRAFHILNEWGVEVFRTGHFANLRGPLEGSLSADGSLFYIDLAGDTRGTTIGKLNLFGEPEAFDPRQPASGWSPDHLILDSAGNLLSLDTSSRILALHDAGDGSLLWQQLILDDAAGDLGLGRPFCAPDGRIFVPGGESHQVHVYSAEGVLVQSFGRFGTGPGGLVFPVGVALGPNESILVLDRMRHKILIFDSAYEYVTEVGRAGIYAGQFYHPLSIAATDDGRVYVSQGFQSRVQIFKLLFEELN